MSKKTIMVITVIAAVTIFYTMNIGCGATESSKIVTYIDEDNGFTIDHPYNWNIETPSNPPELKVSIYEKEIGLNPVGILVGKYEAPGYDLESFTEFRGKFLSDNCIDYHSISKENLTINGIYAIKHFYTETIGQISYKKVEVCIIKDDTGWIICFNSPGKTFDNYAIIYDRAFESFKIVK